MGLVCLIQNIYTLKNEKKINPGYLCRPPVAMRIFCIFHSK